MLEKLDTTSSMDAADRMQTVAASSSTVLVDFFTGPTFSDQLTAGSALTCIPLFRSHVASRATCLMDDLRRAYLSGERGAAPASPYLNKTRPIYEFVRLTLGIKMHGAENYNRFMHGLGVDEVTVGQNVSLIHEVRDLLDLVPPSHLNANTGYARWSNAIRCRRSIPMSGLKLYHGQMYIIIRIFCAHRIFL